MKALILDGAATQRDLAAAACAALTARLEERGHEVVRRDLTALEVPDCNGDFGCWTVSPGVCVQPGPHRDLAREIIRSELLILVTPLSFGGYASPLKRVLDHCLPLITSAFARVGGETHHPLRYPRFPALLAVGLQERADPAAAALLARLVGRNARNFRPPHSAGRCLTRADLPSLASLAGRWLDELLASAPAGTAEPPLDLAPSAELPAVPARSALLLVGSPRGPGSASAGIAAYLGASLRARGLSVETATLRDCLRADPRLEGLADRVRASGAVALVTPLYVDSLPAPVTEALERLAGAGGVAGGPNRPRLLAVVNSGFPEAHQNETALAICRAFAAEAGLTWIGGLAIGGGGMLAGGPLAALGARARHAVRALDLVAEAVARGAPVPAEAQRLAATLAIPAWLYRVMGERGFRREMARHGTLAVADARPYGS